MVTLKPAQIDTLTPLLPMPRLQAASEAFNVRIAVGYQPLCPLYLGLPSVWSGFDIQGGFISYPVPLVFVGVWGGLPGSVIH